MAALDSFYPMTGVTEQLAQWQKFAQYYCADGVVQSTLSTFTATQHAPPGMSVDVQSGRCFIQGVFGENGTTKTVTIAAADATNPRIDRVVLRCDTVAQDLELLVLTGTAAVSPSAPALIRSATQTDYSLYQVLVGTTVTSIVTANLTDERTYSSPRGIPHATRILTAASTIQPYGPNPLTESHLMIQVTGTTTITNIATSPTPPSAGGLLVLDFISAGCTVQAGGNLVIPRNYVAGTQDAMLMLIYDGSNWLEWGRSGEQAPAHKYFGNPTGTVTTATFASIVAADLPTYGTITMGSLAQGSVGVGYTQNSARAVQFGKYYHAYGQITTTGTGAASTTVTFNLPSGVLFNGGSGTQVGQWRIDAASSYTGNLSGNAAGTGMTFEMATNPMSFWGVTPSGSLAIGNVIFFNITAEIQ